MRSNGANRTDDATNALRVEDSLKLRIPHSRQQVDGDDEEFAHGTTATIIAGTHKTAPHSRIPSYFRFATCR